MSEPIPTVFDDVSENLRTNYVGFASFTLLIWDHIDTFPIEVEHIWMKRKGAIGYLFLINRYLTPLGFMVNLFAYLSPVWTFEKYRNLIFIVPLLNIFRCNHFVRFEGSMTLIGIGIVALMMFLRVQALYHNNRWVTGFVASLLSVVIIVNAWLLTRGEGVVHNVLSHVHACTMIFDPSISTIASSSAWLPLLYDTFILGLTLNRTIPSIRSKRPTHIMRRMLEDGLLYYTVIFTVTLVLTLMIVFAPPGLKNITAQLELLITVTMMSRITLNLRKSGSRDHYTAGSDVIPMQRRHKPQSSQGTVVLIERTVVSDIEYALTDTSLSENDSVRVTQNPRRHSRQRPFSAIFGNPPDRVSSLPKSEAQINPKSIETSDARSHHDHAKNSSATGTFLEV